MNRKPAPWGAAFVVGLAFVAGFAPGIAMAQSAALDGDFIYRARPRDTLIALGRRLLREPRRWQEVQRRNRIANPRRIPLGSAIRIPYAWLRMTAETAVVITVSGVVLGDDKPLAKGAVVREGSRIETGPDGSVTLDLADGSLITLQKSTVLRLDTLQQVTGVESAHDLQLRLERGHIQTAVKPHGDLGRFEIETPVAVSAVRGTRFRTAFDAGAGAAADETLEGTVAVSGTGSAVSVPAGFGTRVERGGAPIPPVPLLVGPDLSGIPPTNSSPQLRLEWFPVAGAARYHVQLAPDPDFRTTLSDVLSAAPRLVLAAPPDGAFWLRVRAIDRLGIEGLDTTKAMVQHELPPAPRPVLPRPGARIAGTRASFSWSGTVAATRYRLQLGRDSAFSALVIDKEIEGTTAIALDGVPPGKYFWRIAAVDARDELGAWSAPRSYIQRPSPPVLRAPRLERHVLELQWDGATAARYHIQLARDPTFARPFLDRDVDEPRLSLRRPRAGTYYARIQIVDIDGTPDPYGEPRRFEVPVPKWVRFAVPVAAVALALLL